MIFLNCLLSRLSKSKEFVLLLIFGLLFVTALPAQGLITKSFSEITTLPDDEFYDILHDSKGNYWFCADTGLYRFDGISFTHYTHELQRGQSLFNLKEDGSGRIWCNSLHGQFFFIDPSQDTLEFFLDVSDEFTGRLPTYELYEEFLQVKLDNYQLFQYNVKTKEKSLVIDKTSPFTNMVRIQDHLYYFHLNHLIDLNLKTRSSKQFSKRFRGSIPKLYVLQGDLYILNRDANYKTLDLYALVDEQFVRFDLPKEVLQKEAYDIYKDSKGLLYFATEKGAYVMEEADRHFQFKFSILEHTKVSKIVEDDFGNYIFCTLDRGIHSWDGQENFQYQASPSGLKSNNLRYIKKWNDNMFLVTDYENNIYSFQFGDQLQLKNKWQLKEEIDGLYVLNHNAYAIENENYVTQIDKDLHKKESFQFSSVKDMAYHKNRVYVGHTYRLESLEAFEKNVSKKVIRKKRCVAVESFKEQLYATFTDGVFKIRDTVLTPITYEGSSLYGDQLIAGKEFLWIIKRNQGIFYGKDTTFLKLRSLDGKGIIVKNSDDGIYLIEDHNLYRINERTLTLELVKSLHTVLRDRKVQDFEIHKSSCLITTDNGLLHCSIYDAEQPETGIATKIGNILINDVPKERNKLQSLAYDQNSIKLFLRNNNILGRAEYTFQYRLNTASKTWQPIADIKDPINLNYLSPSTYELTYQTLKENRVIHEETLGFTILDPYWKRWWFVLLVILISLGIMLIILRLYLSKLKARQNFELEQLDLEKNLAEAKLQNLSSQMNPHFTFNALNTVQGLILDDKKNDAYTYLAHFSNLLRKSIDFSSKNYNTLEEEIAFLNTYLKIEAKRFKDNLDFTIDTSKLESLFYKIPPMVLQPFVENAVKHGLLHREGSKKLQISFESTTDKIICTIEDNGIGRKVSSTFSKNNREDHLNMATSSIRKRFDLYKKRYNIFMDYLYEDLYDENANPTGTKVTILISMT